MPADYRLLEGMRAISAELVTLAGLRGWEPAQREAFEVCSSLLWTVRGILLDDRDRPDRRRRVAVLEDARAAARSIDLSSADHRERDIAAALTTRAVAEALGMRASAVMSRARRRGIGLQMADGRNGQMIFTEEDVRALATPMEVDRGGPRSSRRGRRAGD